MYCTYHLTDKEKGKKITSFWDGDCTIYTVYENDEEYEKDLKRIKRLQEEHERNIEAYLKCGSTDY